MSGAPDGLGDLLSQAFSAAGVSQSGFDPTNVAAADQTSMEELARKIKSSPTLQPLLGGSAAGSGNPSAQPSPGGQHQQHQQQPSPHGGARGQQHHLQQHNRPSFDKHGGGGQHNKGGHKKGSHGGGSASSAGAASNPNLLTSFDNASSQGGNTSSFGTGLMPIPDFTSEVSKTNRGMTSTAGIESAAEPREVPRSRRIELDAGTEYRVLVDDKLYDPVTVKVCHSERGPDPTRTAEIFGKEMVIEQEYSILPGSRSGFYTWRGCTLQITGPTVQEFAAANPQMNQYANCAAVIERRRIRAIEVGAAAPRVMVCGSDGSGKSVVSEILWHYAIRRARTPLYVETDTRYTASVSEPLKGLPSCVHCAIPKFLEEEQTKRITFFYGNMQWSDNIPLYEQVCSRLATVVNKKLMGSSFLDQVIANSNANTAKELKKHQLELEMSEDVKRISQSGLILNAPSTPTVDILQTLVRQFYIDTILCIDDHILADKLRKAFETENVDVAFIDKTDGAFHEDAQTLRMQRHMRMREYFQGVSPISNGFPFPQPGEELPLVLQQFVPLTAYHGSFPLHQVNLLQYTTRLEYRSDMDGNIRSFPQLTTSVFDRTRLSELIHTALAVIRAQSEEDLQYMQLAGYILVTGIDISEGILHVAMPDVPPLPSNYFLVPNDIRNMTFLEALS
ncbi:unnamed protein product [Amoebophrya sp. A120]|nr:unnamed protein product [Amoebophrya sp. A120]|eukprot:GSA120T00015827001.1